MAQRRRRRNIAPAVVRRLEDLAIADVSAAAIHGQLQRDAHSGSYEFGPQDVPSLRTVQDVVNELRGLDTSGSWTIADARDGEEARLVLETLAAVIEATEGKRREITRGEAAWVIRIRRAAPDLHPWEAFRLARTYLRLEERGEPSGFLDAFLAFAPWRSPEHFERTKAAIRKGWLPAYRGGYPGAFTHFTALEAAGLGTFRFGSAAPGAKTWEMQVEPQGGDDGR